MKEDIETTRAQLLDEAAIGAFSKIVQDAFFNIAERVVRINEACGRPDEDSGAIMHTALCEAIVLLARHCTEEGNTELYLTELHTHCIFLLGEIRHRDAGRKEANVDAVGHS